MPEPAHAKPLELAERSAPDLDVSEVTETWMQSGDLNGCSLEWWLDQNNRETLLKQGRR